MKFIIDNKKLEEYNLEIEEVIYLMALYFRKDITDDIIKTLKKKGYVISYNPGHKPQYKLTFTGSNLIENVLLTSEIGGSDKKPERYEELAKKLRELYPEGRKPGTNYMWRDSNVMIAKKLKTVVKKYGDCFTDEEAIDATKRYIASFNGNYTLMQLLKYFILKNVNKCGEMEETSQLLSWIENKDSEKTIDSDWASNLV